MLIFGFFSALRKMVQMVQIYIWEDLSNWVLRESETVKLSVEPWASLLIIAQLCIEQMTGIRETMVRYSLLWPPLTSYSNLADRNCVILDPDWVWTSIFNSQACQEYQVTLKEELSEQHACSVQNCKPVNLQTCFRLLYFWRWSCVLMSYFFLLFNLI